MCAFDWSIKLPQEVCSSFEEYQLLDDETKREVAQTFARQFKRAKKSMRGLSYRRIAERIDVEYTAPAKWAAGAWIPKAHNIEQLAELFGVHSSWFFTDRPHPNEFEVQSNRRQRIRLFGRHRDQC